MDRLRAMHVFSTIATERSLSAAARKLGVPLATVSRQLASLEDHIGTALVARTTRKLALTSAGRRYLETCTHVLDEISAVESQISDRTDPMSGEISLTAPVAFGRKFVLPIVLQFLSQHPNVEARLHLVDHVVDLVTEDIDIAIRIGALPDSTLLATKVGALGHLTCAAPAYLRQRGKPTTPAALAAHDCIAFANLPNARQWTFASKAQGRHTVRVNARLAVTTAEAAVDAAIAGLGITRVLSYQAAQAIAQKKLTALLSSFDDTAIPIHVVRRERLRPRLATQRFVEILVRTLRAQRFGA